MKVAWDEVSIKTNNNLNSVRFTNEETLKRKEFLFRVIEDKVLSYGEGAKKAVERNRKGSFVIIVEGYRVYYSFREYQGEPYILIEDVRHGRQR